MWTDEQSGDEKCSDCIIAVGKAKNRTGMSDPQGCSVTPLCRPAANGTPPSTSSCHRTLIPSQSSTSLCRQGFRCGGFMDPAPMEEKMFAQNSHGKVWFEYLKIAEIWLDSMVACETDGM